MAIHEHIVPAVSSSPSVNVVSEMLSLAQQKNDRHELFISLGAGGPAVVEVLTPYSQVFSEIGAKVYSSPERWAPYGSPTGLPALKDIFALKNNAEISEGYFQRKDIIISNGAGQQALDLLRRALTRPGDVVLSQAPTYLGALANFESEGVQVAGVSIDTEGMKPDALQTMISQIKQAGKRIGFLYLNPTFSNPSGGIMSWERKKIIYEIARENDIIIIEDDPYRCVSNPNIIVPPPIATLDNTYPEEDSRVIIIDSVSKIIAPGIRKAAILTKSPELIARLTDLATNSNLAPDLPNQLFLIEMFKREGLVDNISQRYATISYERQQLMGATLEKYGARNYLDWNEPQGGLFYYVKTKDSRINVQEVRKRLHNQPISEEIVPSIACYPSSTEFNPPPPQNEARINFTGLKRTDIDDAIRIFIREIRSEQIRLNPDWQDPFPDSFFEDPTIQLHAQIG